MKNIDNKYFFIKYDVSTHDVYGEIIQDLKKREGSYYVFIDHDWEYCGCFQVDSLLLLRDDFSFGSFITDDIVFIESSFTSKIVIDYYEMNNNFYIDMTFYNNHVHSTIKSNKTERNVGK